MPSKKKPLLWLRLDNAAKIYPAARSQTWSNTFRLSATLSEEVDIPVLENALVFAVRRFPSIAARLRKGLFWYYLQQLPYPPEIRQESSYPLTYMSPDEARQCAFRVLVWHDRIAVEFFHSLTDGNGGLVFLQSLVAEYLRLKHSVSIPAGQGILDLHSAPEPEELEDSFLKYAGAVSAPRQENDAWHVYGTREPDGFQHLTCLRLPVHAALEKAHQYGVSLTAYLGAVMVQALQDMQAQQEPEQKHRKPIRIQIPVDLRRLFPSRSLRNFALYTTPEIDPRLGAYTFDEICDAVRHRMGLEVNAKVMSAKIAANVGSEKLLAVKLMPLFLKNIVLKAVFLSVGERKSCLSMSNLGAVKLPAEMAQYVKRMDFILSSQSSQPHNCGILSYGDILYINFIRNIREPALEYHFFRVLQSHGLPVTAESNGPN
jgi:NRPS condensation-like uncharacterized protein